MSTKKGTSNVPALTRSQALDLMVDGHTIGAMSGIHFYALCETLLQDKPEWWRIIKPLVRKHWQIDEYTKWFVILELLRAGVVVVRDRTLFVKEVAA